MTSHPAEGDTPTHGPAPPTPTFHAYSSASISPGQVIPTPFFPGSPTMDLSPPEKRRVHPWNRGGSDLFLHVTGTLPPASGGISGLISGNRPGNCRGDTPRAFPPCLYCSAATGNVRDATRGNLSSRGIPSTILCRGGHTGQHRTTLVTGGPGEWHTKYTTCISMHPIDGMVHPGGDAAEGKGWI